MPFAKGVARGGVGFGTTHLFISLELGKCVLNPPERPRNEFPNVPLARSRMCDIDFKENDIAGFPMNRRIPDEQICRWQITSAGCYVAVTYATLRIADKVFTANVL